jgi:putative chitinase
MKFDRKVFFTYVRRSPFGGKLSQEQVDGMNDMLDWFEKSTVEDVRWVARVFAEVHHETGALMIPVRETFASSTRQAIARLNDAFNKGRMKNVRTRYWLDGWFGRGRIQVTHRDNYVYAQEKTGLQLVSNPDLLLLSKNDVRVSLPGTIEGWWTRGKHSMSDYFNETTDDPVGARRIVNGTDKAKHIAENFYVPYLSAFKAAEISTPLPVDIIPEAETGDGKSMTESTTFWSAILTAVMGAAGSLVAAIDNPYALAFGVVAVLASLWIIRERMKHSYRDGV